MLESYPKMNVSELKVRKLAVRHRVRLDLKFILSLWMGEVGAMPESIPPHPRIWQRGEE